MNSDLLTSYFSVPFSRKKAINRCKAGKIRAALKSDQATRRAFLDKCYETKKQLNRKKNHTQPHHLGSFWKLRKIENDTAITKHP